MKIGIATLVCSSVRTAPDIDMFAALEMLAEAGFDCVEYNDQSSPQFFRASDAEMAQVRRKAEELGIELWSAHSPCGDYDLTSLDDEKYAEALAVHLRSVAALSVAGVKHFVVHQVGGPVAEWPQRFGRSAEAVGALCEAGERRDVKILIENFTGYGSRELLQLIDAVRSPQLGIVFDVGHAHRGVLPLASEVRLCGEHLTSLHVHDNHGPTAGDEHLPPTWGTVNWREFLDALADVGYAGPFLMEVIRESEQLASVSPHDTVAICAKAARQLLAQPR